MKWGNIIGPRGILSDFIRLFFGQIFSNFSAGFLLPLNISLPIMV